MAQEEKRTKARKGGPSSSSVAPVTPATSSADGSELACLSQRLMNLTLFEDQAHIPCTRPMHMHMHLHVHVHMHTLS